jgi:outer membrane protein TolC
VQAFARPPGLHDLIPVGDGAALLKRRPDVRQADRRVAAATARIACVRAAGFDAVVLQALKETEQALSIYGAELNRRQALSEAQERAHRYSTWRTIT